MDEIIKKHGICHMRKDGSLICYDRTKRKFCVILPAIEVQSSEIANDDMVALMEKVYAQIPDDNRSSHVLSNEEVRALLEATNQTADKKRK